MIRDPYEHLTFAQKVEHIAQAFAASAASPALRAENERRAEEREAIYREVFGLPDMSRIEARKHVGLMRGKAA